MPRGNRTPEEQEARGLCRSLAHSEGSYVRKVDKKWVFVGQCDKWPDGILTEYHGWCDLLVVLRYCVKYPDQVVKGKYHRPEEIAA